MVDSAQDLIDMWQNNQNIIPPQFENAIQNITDNLGTYAEKNYDRSVQCDWPSI